MKKKKIALIFIGLFIFGFIVGVSQSKEKILADRQAIEDRKIAAQQRAEAEKQAQEEKKNAKEEKKKAKEEAKNKPESAPEGVPNISERPADACSVQPSDKFWVPKAQVDELFLEKGPHVVTKEEEGAYGISDGFIQIETNWYCPESQPQTTSFINLNDKEVLGFYVLEGETIYVLSHLYSRPQSNIFPELGRVKYKPVKLVTDYTLPGRRYE